MNREQAVLQMWVAIKTGDGLSKAKKVSKLLLVAGLVICLLIALSVYHQFNPLYSIVLSIALGWLTAERNALRSRVEMWPKLDKYLDWEKIQESIKK